MLAPCKGLKEVYFMKFRTCYSVKGEKAGTVFDEPTMTIQSEKDSCDINCIMERYERTGIMQHVASVQPLYEDVADIQDYQGSLLVLEKAQAAFDALPAKLRKELDNNPYNLVPFIQNPANKERCYEYGLLNKPVNESSKIVVSPVPADSGAVAPSVSSDSAV